MKLALEALELVTWTNNPPVNKAITALQEALAEPATEESSAVQPTAQPQQEPVAWRVKWPAIGGGYKWLMVDKPLMEKEGFVNEALYTSPPAQEFVCSTGLCHYRKPLPDEQVLDCWKQAYDPGRREHDNATRMARAIEAAHGIKENA